MFVLLLAFVFATSWVGAFVALTARSVEVAQSLGLVWLFPVAFVSVAFVSIEAMPAPLRVFAQWNPVTAVASAARELFGNALPAGFARPMGWPADNPVLYAFLSSAAVSAIFAPLAVRRYIRISVR